MSILENQENKSQTSEIALQSSGPQTMRTSPEDGIKTIVMESSNDLNYLSSDPGAEELNPLPTKHQTSRQGYPAYDNKYNHFELKGSFKKRRKIPRKNKTKRSLNSDQDFRGNEKHVHSSQFYSNRGYTETKITRSDYDSKKSRSSATSRQYRTERNSTERSNRKKLIGFEEWRMLHSSNPKQRKFIRNKLRQRRTNRINHKDIKQHEKKYLAGLRVREQAKHNFIAEKLSMSQPYRPPQGSKRYYQKAKNEYFEGLRKSTEVKVSHMMRGRQANALRKKYGEKVRDVNFKQYGPYPVDRLDYGQMLNRSPTLRLDESPRDDDRLPEQPLGNSNLFFGRKIRKKRIVGKSYSRYSERTRQARDGYLRRYRAQKAQNYSYEHKKTHRSKVTRYSNYLPSPTKQSYSDRPGRRIQTRRKLRVMRSHNNQDRMAKDSEMFQSYEEESLSNEINAYYKNFGRFADQMRKEDQSKVEGAFFKDYMRQKGQQYLNFSKNVGVERLNLIDPIKRLKPLNIFDQIQERKVSEMKRRLRDKRYKFNYLREKFNLKRKVHQKSISQLKEMLDDVNVPGQIVLDEIKELDRQVEVLDQEAHWEVSKSQQDHSSGPGRVKSRVRTRLKKINQRTLSVRRRKGAADWEESGQKSDQVTEGYIASIKAKIEILKQSQE